MNMLINGLVGLIAFQHIGFLLLEMFLWEKPVGLKVFRMTPEMAKVTATLAANQGLYNGFLAAGLVWSLFANPGEFAHSLKLFFLTCVLVAGLYGWYSVSRNILFIQALPAAVTLALLIIKAKSST